MGHDALPHVRQAGEQLRRQEAGAGAAEDHLVVDDLIQLSKNLLLQLQVFWNAFLKSTYSNDYGRYALRPQAKRLVSDSFLKKKKTTTDEPIRKRSASS